MKVTRLGYPQPILNSGTGLNAGGRVPPGGNDLTVLTSNGSNGRYWGENVARITANGSNTLLSPYVNFASGSNITFSISSNTLTIHGQAGGSGSLTVSDEGTPLATAATTLDFVGAGVTASGAGATKTITISGGSGAAELPLDIAPGSPHAKDDEFPGSSLDAKWTNPLSSGTGLDLTLAVANGWVTFEPATTGSASTGKRGTWGIRQASPTGSFSVSAKVVNVHPGANDDCVAGLFVARTASTQVNFLGKYVNAAASMLLARAVGSSSYSESGDTGAFDGYVQDSTNGYHMGLSWFKIVWDSGAGTLAFWYSGDGVAWSLLHTRTSQSQPDRFGLAIWSNTAGVLANHQLAADWFRVTEP